MQGEVSFCIATSRPAPAHRGRRCRARLLDAERDVKLQCIEVSLCSDAALFSHLKVSLQIEASTQSETRCRDTRIHYSLSASSDPKSNGTDGLIGSIHIWNSKSPREIPLQNMDVFCTMQTAARDATLYDHSCFSITPTFAA
jgi:hypothetical protein